MADTIEVGTDWESIVERDPKDVAAEIDRLRAALQPIAAAHLGMLPVTIDVQRQWVLAARTAIAPET